MDWTDEALSRCLDKTRKNIANIGEKFPHVADQGVYNDQGAGFWTAGFWPGLLWLLYRELQDVKALELARRLEKCMDPVLDGFMSLHHDVGFMWLLSAVADYRLTGQEISRVRGLKAASHLAGRFNLAGRFIRAWTDEVYPDSQGWSIIDCMMNLPLLYWASKELMDPRFYHIAVAHSNTVMMNFFRPDHSCAHIVRFDPYTGQKLGCLRGQGKDAFSAWSRGQAWAVYGFAVAYRETGREEYLQVAKNSAEYFWEHLPEDKIPYWDFCADEKNRWVRDSSAAACAASGFLLLGSLIKIELEKEVYRTKALDILQALYENCLDKNENSQAILTKGTVNYAGKKHINSSIIYGDYFFMEALIRLKHEPGMF